ncbi:MAG: hypothetical protein IIZ33_05025, partial [Erysipelotrichaceae bacterium]|nr:hypothetical protein [Erysipelotrichaceae bacterium]
TLSGHLLYRCVEKLTKSTSLPVFAWILFTILLGTSPWVVVVYSDSLALFIPILVLYLLLKEEMNPYGKTALIGLLSILAFYIKPQAFLILVAAVIIYAIEHISHGKWKRLGIEALILVLSFAAVILPVNAFKEENLEAEKEIGFPHYLLIGANYDTIGSYSAKDLEYSMSFKTKEERNEADIEALEERLEDYGPAKVFDHLVRKTAFTYNDGTFAFGKEGNFYQEFFSLHMPFEKQFRDVFLDIGPYYLYPTIIRQITWFLVLIGGIFAWKGKDDVLPLRVLKVTLFGLFLFELLFEARARYLIVCVPLFIVLCAEGMNRVLKKK